MTMKGKQYELKVEHSVDEFESAIYTQMEKMLIRERNYYKRIGG